ncbi:DNA repair protein RAD51 homolog 2-like [Dipodomys merriami]|uniref:DNA repair protein RAD51 homolog 2-like n=1 Tax=Dipodomys merriami TaxID=94247 RepID=UPI003855908C
MNPRKAAFLKSNPSGFPAEDCQWYCQWYSYKKSFTLQLVYLQSSHGAVELVTFCLVLVILTNQITTHLSGARAAQADLVSPADDLSLTEGTSGSSCVVAALGNTWSHSVNTRLILQHLDSERKQILIAKSPLAPFTSFVYSIKEEGLVLQAVERELVFHYRIQSPQIEERNPLHF